MRLTSLIVPYKILARFLSLYWPMGRKTFLVAELLFAHTAFKTKFDREFSFFRHSGYESTIRNPYFGLEIVGKSSSFFAEAGIRLPRVAPDCGFAMKGGNDFDLDREEAFLDFAVKVCALNRNGLRRSKKS
ncbi:MAG: hypothetical protein ACREOI_29165 [bacterium]